MRTKRNPIKVHVLENNDWSLYNQAAFGLPKYNSFDVAVIQRRQPVKFSKRLPEIAHKVNIFMMMISMLWFSFGFNIAEAKFNDLANSSNNTFTASSLLFNLSSVNPFSPNVTPTADSLRTITMTNAGALGFNYHVKSVVLGGSLCSSLNLNANLDTVSQYNGLLSGFDKTPITFSAPEVWDFTAHLTSSDPALQGTVCSFNLVYSAWQTTITEGAGGFTDILTVNNTVTAGTWADAPVDDQYSPISDSFADQDNATTNNGTATTLLIQSRQDGSNHRNQRSYLQFDFKFPNTTVVNSSSLNLFMTAAPIASRTYQTRKVVTTPWTETGITWNNQPCGITPNNYGTCTSVTNSQASGTTSNAWLSWNVASDVQGFVASPSANLGWVLNDAAEDPGNGNNFNSTFSSRENATEANRPYLQVNFTTPAVTTNHLVVNEIYPSVSASKGTETSNEWVEIYNPTASSVDISGWQICDGAVSTPCDSIPAATPVIPSHGFALVANSVSTWSSFWPGTPAGAIKIGLGTTIGSNGLDNAGDRVILKDATVAHNVIDSMSYGSDTSLFTLPAPKIGISLARIVKGYDTDTANDWVLNNTPNPGTNPSVNGTEVMRFTSDGIEVAATEEGLPPIINTAVVDPTDPTAVDPVIDQPEIDEPMIAPGEPVVVDQPVIDMPTVDEPATPTTDIPPATDNISDDTVPVTIDTPADTAVIDVPADVVVPDATIDSHDETIISGDAPAKLPDTDSAPAPVDDAEGGSDV